MHRELLAVQAGYRKGRGTRDQIAKICWIIGKAESSRKTCFCFIDYDRAFDCVDHNKLWKFLQEMGIPDHLTCLQRNLYAGQEATVRNVWNNSPEQQTGKTDSLERQFGATDWIQIRKGAQQGCILSPCIFSLYIK